MHNAWSNMSKIYDHRLILFKYKSAVVPVSHEKNEPVVLYFPLLGIVNVNTGCDRVGPVHRAKHLHRIGAKSLF